MVSLSTRTVAQALAKLPLPVQTTITSPATRKLLAVVVALGIIQHFNKLLSQRVLNNWQTDATWDWSRELVLLTGGCSGIGQAVAQDLAARDIKVVILDIQEPQSTLPHNVHFYKTDVTSSDNVRTVATKIRSEHGDPTVLINNAGIAIGGTILDKPETTIRKIFEVNTLAHFVTVKEFLPSMIRRNHGHIVTIASAASFIACGEMVDYSCTKASALAFHEGLTQELRLWYGAKRVRTSIIHPMWVRTPLIKPITDAGNLFRQPVLEVEYVSSVIVKQLLSGRSGQVILPSRMAGLTVLRALPSWLQEVVRGAGSRNLKRIRDH